MLRREGPLSWDERRPPGEGRAASTSSHGPAASGTSRAEVTHPVAARLCAPETARGHRLAAAKLIAQPSFWCAARPPAYRRPSTGLACVALCCVATARAVSSNPHHLTTPHLIVTTAAAARPTSSSSPCPELRLPSRPTHPRHPTTAFPFPAPAHAPIVASLGSSCGPIFRAARPPACRRRLADLAWAAEDVRHSTWPPPQAASRAHLDSVADSPSPALTRGWAGASDHGSKRR
ncbi:hypothetical protein ACCO45_011211 [Purpureocillium lilacinum]|uniref:Uncharacterized protein n=1 Tax=Purpureocillium lilacinum TaxID=33203 RepID=A0ACC4DHT1_PURLI